MPVLSPLERDRATEVPMSLSLVEKKKAILQAELRKMEQRLRDRSATLSQLRRHHEELLSINGQLQQRSSLRKDRLNRLQQCVNQLGSPNHTGMAATSSRSEDATTDSDTVSKKCATMAQLVDSLIGKQELLEQGCMELEDALSHKTDALQRAKLQLGEATETFRLSVEDIRSVEWAFEMEQSAVREAESKLRLLGQQLELEALALEQSSSKCQEQTALRQDLITARDTFCSMAAEAYEQLLADKSEASSVWKKSLSKLGRPGATCAKDEEVHQIQIALTAKIDELTQFVITTKATRRELVFRTKQEKEMMSLAKSSIKAKEDQLEWLERQRAFLDCEYQSLVNSRAASQAAHDESVLVFKRTLMTLDKEKFAAKTAIEQIDDELSDVTDALTALNGRLSKERKSLGQQVRKRNARQKQLKNSTATLDLVRAESKSVQQTLETVRSAQQNHQATLDKLTVENEELRVKCAQLHDQSDADERALSALDEELQAESRLVASKMSKLRDVYLHDSDFSDWRGIIPRINREVENAKVQEQSDLQQQSSNLTAQLHSKYEAMFVSLNETFGKMLREKQAEFDAVLKRMHTARVETGNSRRGASLEEGPAPRIEITTGAVETKENEHIELPRSRAEYPPLITAPCAGACDKVVGVVENPPQLASDGTQAATPIREGTTCGNSLESSRADGSQTRTHRDSSQVRSAGHFEVNPARDATVSTSTASPQTRAPSPVRRFTPPLSVMSNSKSRNSTKKRLQLREKPRRKAHNQRRLAVNRTNSTITESAASVSRVSDSETTSTAVRQPETVADLTGPAEGRTWPVAPSSGALVSPRHSSDTRQHQTNEEVHVRQGRDNPRGGKRTAFSSAAVQSHQALSNQPQADRTRSWVGSEKNKENEPPSTTPTASAAPKSAKATALDHQLQQSQRTRDSVVPAVRSGCANHRSKTNVGATIVRKKTAKRSSLNGRKKSGASSALLSRTISGTGTPNDSIIDARAIRSLGSGSAGKNGVRRPTALASDWFATDSFSFD